MLLWVLAEGKMDKGERKRDREIRRPGVKERKRKERMGRDSEGEVRRRMREKREEMENREEVKRVERVKRERKGKKKDRVDGGDRDEKRARWVIYLPQFPYV